MKIDQFHTFRKNSGSRSRKIKQAFIIFTSLVSVSLFFELLASLIIFPDGGEQSGVVSNGGDMEEK